MGPLKQSLVENISLQICNCNIFGLTDTVALFAKEAGFFSDLGCSSGQVLSKTKSVTPHFFFTFLTSQNNNNNNNNLFIYIEQVSIYIFTCAELNPLKNLITII